MINKRGNLKVLIFDLDDTLFDSTNQPEDTGESWSLKLFEGLLPVLTSDKYKNILVTKGVKELQNRKIDVLGIRDYFWKIHIVGQDKDKYEYFKGIVSDFSQEEVAIVGNRIDQEIRFGNLLGLKTIFIKHGKYQDKIPKDSFELPHHTFRSDDILTLEGIL